MIFKKKAFIIIWDEKYEFFSYLNQLTVKNTFELLKVDLHVEIIVEGNWMVFLFGFYFF